MRRQAWLPVLIIILTLGMSSAIFAWTHNEHIHNNTGQTINDVHKVLRGRWAVPEMMTTTFPNTSWELALVDGEWETHLTWWGANVPHCQYVDVCFTAADPVTGEPAPGAEIIRAWWSRDGQRIAWMSPVLSANGEITTDGFCLNIGNFSMQDSLAAPPVFVTDMAVAFVNQCIPIEDLNYEVMYDPNSTLPWQQLPPMDVLVHGQWYQQICYPADSYWCILRMTLEDGTDPNEYYEFMKFAVLPGGPSATDRTTWGRVKVLYR